METKEVAKQLARLQATASKLASDIEALAAQLTPAKSDSVATQIRRAAHSLAEQGKTVFDHADLLGSAIAANPTEDKKLKSGVYLAVKALIDRGDLRRVPGGFSV